MEQHFTLKNSPRVQRAVDEIVKRRNTHIRKLVVAAIREHQVTDAQAISNLTGIGLPAVLRALGDEC